MNDNGKNLLEKITDLDPELIAGAEKKPRRISNLFIGITSGMATLAAAALIAVAVNHNLPAKPPIVDTNSSAPSSGTSSDSGASSSSGSDSATDSSSGKSSVQEPASDPPQLDFSEYSYLPKISTKNYSVTGYGSGGGLIDYEGMYLWELDYSSPWKGADLKTMPVYMSDSTEIPDLDRMYARVKEIAAALGISEDKLTITDTYHDMTDTIEQHRKWGEEAGDPPEEIEALIDRMVRQVMSMVEVEAVGEGISICLNTAYEAIIDFDEPIELPREYNFSNSATAEEKEAVMSYLAERYKALTGYGDSVSVRPEAYGGYVYDANGDITQQIVNYWINSTDFYIDNNTGKLEWIRVQSDSALENLDNYPILTSGQAEAILKSNKYDGDNRMPADANILKTEMVYYNMAGSTAVIPYYEFYVESDKDYFSSSGYDVICKVYTIAAIPEEFIDMETTDYGVRA
ncbi:MAG: hypothetical protein J1F04_04660 [Oscillospiraceae bacterium]|nr:hypothetical protein [Oscillospiraceae bacterium]